MDGHTSPPKNGKRQNPNILPPLPSVLARRHVFLSELFLTLIKLNYRYRISLAPLEGTVDSKKLLVVGG